jgi:hypothetical protein
MGPSSMTHRQMVAALAIVSLGCSGRGVVDRADGGGGDATGVTPLFYPCASDNRIGGFAIQLHEPEGGDPGYTTVAGRVDNGVGLFSPYSTPATDGCFFDRVRPTCILGCPGNYYCAAQDECRPAPVGVGVGIVDVSGLAVPVSVSPLSSVHTYVSVIEDPYPPFAPDDDIVLQASGDVLPPFALRGRGISPMRPEFDALHVVRDQPLSIRWTPPSQPDAARVFAWLNLDGERSDEPLVCTFPDTGSAVIPAELINAALDRGVSYYSSLTIGRRTLDSTNLAAGCVDFDVASQVVQVPVTVEGIVFCGTGLGQCPEGYFCDTRNWICEPLSAAL